MPTGLKTRIETPHFDECLRFYMELLCLELVESWDHGDDRGAILGLGGGRGGQAFLELASSSEEPPLDRQAHRLHSQEYRLDGMSLQLRVDDLAPVVERLRGRVDFAGPTPRPWGSVYVYTRDPAGVAVIVYEGDV